MLNYNKQTFCLFFVIATIYKIKEYQTLKCLILLLFSPDYQPISLDLCNLKYDRILPLNLPAFCL